MIRCCRWPSASTSRPEEARTEAAVDPHHAASLWFLLRRKKVWGLALGMAAYNYNFYLFLTWLPGYLNTALHLNILQSGFYTAIPWLAATVSDLLVGGWLVDHLIRSGRDSTRVRQTILVAGLVLGLAVAGATRTTNPRVAIFWISIALCGLAASAPVGWSIPGLIAPPGSTARVAGIMNFVANLPAILAPVITGYLVGNSQSFRRPFLVAAAVLVAGILSYIFLLGKIETIPGPAATSSHVNRAARSFRSATIVQGQQSPCNPSTIIKTTTT